MSLTTLILLNFYRDENNGKDNKKCSLKHFQVTIPLQTDRPSFVTGWRIQHALIQSGATFDDSVYRISKELGLMMKISG